MPSWHQGAISLDILDSLLAAAPETRVLTLTGRQDGDLHRRAVCLGALGLVHKSKPAEVLFQAIEKIHAGEVWLDRRMMASVHREMTRGREARKPDPEGARISKLTDREREIVRLVAEPLKNRQIAARPAIAEPTVRHHLTSIFEKLGVDGRLGLAVSAIGTASADWPSRQPPGSSPSPSGAPPACHRHGRNRPAERAVAPMETT